MAETHASWPFAALRSIPCHMVSRMRRVRSNLLRSCVGEGVEPAWTAASRLGRLGCPRHYQALGLKAIQRGVHGAHGDLGPRTPLQLAPDGDAVRVGALMQQRQ